MNTRAKKNSQKLFCACDTWRISMLGLIHNPKFLLTQILCTSAFMASAQTLRNDLSLSDPAVMADPISQNYYMTGTGGDIFKSNDLEIWEKLPWAIHTDDISWIGSSYNAPAPGQIWAPELYYKDGAYYNVVTFTNPNATTEGTDYSRRSIHILKSNNPEGPYEKIEGSDELYLPASKMAIDGTIWEEEGNLYLVYCFEWVQAGNGAIEYIQLKPDLTGTIGESHTICHAYDGKAWNNSSVTDGPFIFRTQTGRLGMIWTSWRDGVYVQGVSYSDNGHLDGNWSHEPMPITPDNHGHGMMFRTFDGQLLMSIHSNRNIDLDNQHFERHPVFFVMDDSGDKLRAVMQYRKNYNLNNPADVVVPNAGMDYSTNGWICNSNSVNKGIASNQGNAITGKFFECWDSKSFTGEIFQETTLPNGTYKLSAAAFRSYPASGYTEDNDAVCLFANEETCQITSATPETYNVVVHVTDGILRFGIRSNKKNYQWMGIDNVSLTYYGTELIENEVIEYIDKGGDAVYLMHEQTGKYLNCGESWGTQAILESHALDLYMYELPDGKYAIDTKIDNGNANHYIGSNGYVDATYTPFQINTDESGRCTIIANSLYWGAEDDDIIIRRDYTTPSSATSWIMKSKADLMTELANADSEHPADATFMLYGANFGRNDTRVQLYWNGEFKTGGDVSNQCAEAPSEKFDIWQEVSDIPNGIYEVRMQGFYQDGTASVASTHRENGTEHLEAVLYANDEEIPVMSIFEYANNEAIPDAGGTNTTSGFIPTTLEAASATFSAGLYENKLLVEVTNGILRIGVKKTTENTPNGNCTKFDNFELYYLGSKQSSAINKTETEADKIIKKPGIYDLNGRKISKEYTEAVHNLPNGIYIVNGEKTIIGE